MKQKTGVKPILLIKVTAMLLVVMIPLLTGYGFIFNQGYRLASERTIYSINTRQEYIVNTLEKELMSIYYQQMDITFNEDISYLIDMYHSLSDYRLYTLMLQIQKHLSTFMNGNPWVQNAVVILPGLDRMIEGEQGITPIGAEFEKQITLRYAEFFHFEIIDGAFSLVNQVHDRDGNLRYLCIVRLSDRYVMEMLDYLYSQHPTNTILFFVQTGKPIAASDGMQDIAPAVWTAMAGKDGTEPEEILIDAMPYMVRQDLFFFDNLSVVSIVDVSTAFGDLHTYSNDFIYILIASMFLIIWFLVFFYRMFTRPFSKLVQAFSRLRKGDFDVDIKYQGHDEFSELYESFVYMTKQIKSHIHDRYEQQLLMQQADMRQLQAQVDPHFLNNSFLSIAAMAQMEDHEGVQEMAEKLSRYYQYTTKLNVSVVTMQDEFQFAELYAEIQQIRFSDRVRFQLTPLPEICREIPMPRFILQTLVENAYKYGAGTRDADGLIRFSCRTTDFGCEIVVEDNGDHLSEEDLLHLWKMLDSGKDGDKGTGLRNANRRLRLFYGGESQVQLDRSALGGLRIRMLIDLRKGEGDVSGTHH